MLKGVIDIDIKRILQPYHRRLQAEGILRSVILAGMAVLPVWLSVSVLWRVWGMGGFLLAYMPWIAAAAAALLYLLKYRPTLMETGCRLDAAAKLENRVGTMVEYAENESVLARMQREETIERLKNVPASALRITWSRRAVLVCLVLIALIVTVMHMPQSVMDKLPFAVKMESEEVLMVRGKIEALRATIEGSELKEADRDRLLSQLDVLLERMASGRAELSALQEIRQMMEDMEKTVVELTPRDTYAAAMLEFESLRPLGEAIFKKNMDVVRLVFDNIRFNLHQAEGMEQVNMLMSLVYEINGSLAKPLRDNSQDILRQGMMMMAGGLESAAEMVYNRRDNTQMIDMAIDNAQEFVREYLGVPAQEERYDPYADAAKERANTPVKPKVYPGAAQPVRELTPAETEHVYDPPEGVFRSGYVPGEEDENGNVQRIIAPKEMTGSGTVPYGEVYGAYYAQYLKDKNAGSIPPELDEAIEAYFNGI